MYTLQLNCLCFNESYHGQASQDLTFSRSDFAAMAPDASAVSDAVPVTAIAMKLLDIRLKPSGAIIESAIGEFTSTGKQEIAILRAGGTIELLRVEGQTKLVCRLETRSVLRSLALIRLTGDKRDVLAVGADGGAVSIIDFQDGKAQLVHCTTFGKSGKLRTRSVPTAACLEGLRTAGD